MLSPLLLISVLTQGAGAASAYLGHTQPFLRRFDEANGLPTRSVHSVAAASDDLLWVLSDGGLDRFDGVRFEHVSLPGPHDAPYELLHVDSDGRAWITSVASSTIVYGVPGAWQTLEVPDSKHILAIGDRREGGSTVVYIASGTALYRFSTALSRVEHSASATAVAGVGETLWLAYEGKLVRIDAKGESRDVVLPAATGPVFALVPRRNGGLFVLAENRVLSVTESLVLAEVATLELSRGIAELDDGLWIATQDGRLWSQTNGEWRSVERLSDNSALGEVLALAHKADDDTVWVATDSGLVELMPNEWRRQRPDSPLFGTQAQRFGESGDGGRFFVGGQGPELFEIEGHRVRRLRVGAGNDLVLSLHATDFGAWVGTRSGRVSRVATDVTTTLATTEDDSLFAFTPRGDALLLAQRFGPSLLLNSGKTELALRRTRAEWGRLFAAATVGTRAFVGGEDGVFEVSGERVTSLPMPVRAQVLSLAAEGTEALWVGTAGAGALRFSLADGAWRTLAEPALPNGYIDALTVDASDVWVCTERGVVRVNRDGKQPPRHYTRGNGLPTDTCLHGGMYRDSDGRIWVATNAGAAVLDPARAAFPSRAAPLAFGRVQVMDATVSDDAWRTIPHDRARLAFSYVLPRFVRGEDVRYRTQLVGLEATASDWTTEARREFPTLPAGRYEFRVWAKDVSGAELGPIASAFSVLPPWWQSPWAYLAYGVSIAASAFFVGRLRTAQLQKRARQLELMVEKRTEEVQKQAAEILKQKEALEASYQEADRIFEALKAALKGSILDDRYKLDRELGQGGFGVVYDAEEVRTATRYAVKVFRPQPGNDSVEALERFKREARSGQTFVHPNAIRIFDYGVSSDNIAYMVMELLRGRTLQQELQEKGSVSPARCKAIGVTVARVLAAAHAHGIVHRDIKPDNIFLHEGADGEVIKVLDFGVAKLTAPIGSIEMKTLTMTGAVVGTPTYISPERLSGQEYDGRADVYSLGILLYEILAGKPPFRATSEGLLSLITAHLREPPPPLQARVPTVPAALEHAIMRALTKDPAERPSAAALADELAAS